MSTIQYLAPVLPTRSWRAQNTSPSAALLTAFARLDATLKMESPSVIYSDLSSANQTAELLHTPP